MVTNHWLVTSLVTRLVFLQCRLATLAHAQSPLLWYQVEIACRTTDGGERAPTWCLSFFNGRFVYTPPRGPQQAQGQTAPAQSRTRTQQAYSRSRKAPAPAGVQLYYD